MSAAAVLMTDSASDRRSASASPLRLDVSADASQIAGVRRAVTVFAVDAGVDERCSSDIALAVGEACANVVTHAYRDRPGCGELHVRAAHISDGIMVEVSDDGRGMAPRTDSPGMGLGLPLIASLASWLEVNLPAAGGTELRMLFAAACPPQPRAV